MTSSTPHFLLFSESRAGDVAGQRGGSWTFVLESVDGAESFTATDMEKDAPPNRLALLAVVRGLEALDQPSRVTLVTTSRHVARGLRFGIPHWRESGWRWEEFGRMVPVRDVDLWRRIDQALAFHKVRCRTLRVDGAHGFSGRTRHVRADEGQDAFVPPRRAPDRARARLRHVAGWLATSLFGRSRMPAFS